MRAAETKYEVRIANATERLTEATLHVTRLLDTGEGVNQDVVDAVLWGADTLAWAETGTPMTGVRYLSGPNGPYPEIGQSVQKTLTAAGRARVYYTVDGCRRLEAIDQPRLDLFDKPTIERLASLARAAEGTEGAEFLPNNAWALAANGQPIPYQAIFVSSNRSVSEEDRTRTRDLARRHGWIEESR